jgi:glucokinase
MFPFPAILCDVGGTNARFALMRDAASSMTWLKPTKTSDHLTFVHALRAATMGDPVQVQSVLICAAGPVELTRVQLTNANWSIDGRKVARDLGLTQGLMFNDFEALALSIPTIRKDWMRPIGGGNATSGARVIHGPGTGLGTAALVGVDGKWLAVASEGSHSDFAAVRDDETLIWPHVERREGRITPEALISGPGLRRLHRARFATSGRQRPELSETEITNRAINNPKGEEAETVRLFWRLVARYASDVALTFVGTGGLFLAGGILPRLVSLLDDVEFRSVFDNKAPYCEIVSRIPVNLITEPALAIYGMANIARHPERYAIDYVERAWVV